ncbi:hypothetical protein AXX17_AT2G07640 [Arabidopsis thaliana]|uniref:Uncharacterized protein n=1 Tax=Arabidopsis thaliana TaxID=3702 RepID=A0A178W335_ARATH|nr:hypothetical protein AXX17_AT2G07640 [Arabidopsis thaliana]
MAKSRSIDMKIADLLATLRLHAKSKEIHVDQIAELKQLRETYSIVEYHKKFELRSTRPQTIQQCFSIGRLYEYAHHRSSIDNVGILTLKRDSELKAEEDNEEE